MVACKGVYMLKDILLTMHPLIHSNNESIIVLQALKGLWINNFRR